MSKPRRPRSSSTWDDVVGPFRDERNEQIAKDAQERTGVPYGELLLTELERRVEAGEPIDNVARKIVEAYRHGEFTQFRRRKVPNLKRQWEIAVEVELQGGDHQKVADRIGRDVSVVRKCHRRWCRLARNYARVLKLHHNDRAK